MQLLNQCSYLLDICDDIDEAIENFALAFEENPRGKAACDTLAMLAMTQTIAGTKSAGHTRT